LLGKGPKEVGQDSRQPSVAAGSPGGWVELVLVA
jgi:hypothetical protein